MKRTIIKRMGNRQFPILLLMLALCFGSGDVTGQNNISGKPGLIYVPSAAETKDGAFQFGYNFNPARYGIRYNRINSEGIYFVNLTILPRLEVNVNLLRVNNEAQHGHKGIGDRQIDLKYLILKENRRRPSLAVIISAPFGIDNSLVTNALVVTKTFQISRRIYADFTAGYGSPVYIQRHESEKNNYNIFKDLRIKKKKDRGYQYLSGPIGGMNLRLEKKAGFMAEWDSQHFNFGLYGTFFKRWTIQAGLLNFDQISFGTSYALNLSSKPKSLRGSDKHY